MFEYLQSLGLDPMEKVYVYGKRHYDPLVASLRGDHQSVHPKVLLAKYYASRAQNPDRLLQEMQTYMEALRGYQDEWYILTAIW